MSRELKRVPLDFSWPLDKTWEGYLNPFYEKCPDCESGYTDARLRLQSLVRLIMLSGSDSVQGKNHPYFDHIGRFVSGFYKAPSKDMAELTSGLAGRTADRFFGHDGCDNWSAEQKIITAAGLDHDNWGICQTCKGEAIHPDHKERYENWTKTEPPMGDGYQLWQNVSEGSPQSPVFKTLDELSEWCSINATTFADFKASKDEWKAMLSNDNVHHRSGNIIFL